jgi:predicted ATPase
MEAATEQTLSQMPIIRRFALFGANGYKDIEFTTGVGVKILVAENGAGKTTLLNALYAVLTGNYRALLAVEFDSFELEVNGRSWKRFRADFEAVSSEAYNEIIASPIWRRLDAPVPTRTEAEELVTAIADGEEASIESTRYFSRDVLTRRYPSSYLKTMLQEIGNRDFALLVKRRRDNFRKLSIEVSEALDGYTVLYLPTYRRIEANLPEYRARLSPTKRGPAYKRFAQTDQLIHFGLQDVEGRLSDMAEDIRRVTIREFSQINAKTLDDLLFTSFKRNVEQARAIDLESLHVVLGRLGRNDERTRKRIEKLISTGEIDSEQNIYLKSFLDQLMQTYATTQEREASIEAFIEVVNSYWQGDENEKKFVFDKPSAEASVENTFTGRKLPLEALSSGEKQIISVFAYLYLDRDQKIIMLIDEPELSLSIEWQQKFLPDIVKSPGCHQLIGITHSPFVFKNDLRSYAGPLIVKRHKKIDGLEAPE